MYRFELSRGSAFENRSMTMFLVDESTFLSRDEHIGYILSSLLGEASSNDALEINLHVIALVGMGGIGKMTLAQIAYNHPSV